MDKRSKKKARILKSKRIYLGLMLSVIIIFGISVIYSVYHQPIHEVSHSDAQSTLKAAPPFQLPDDQGRVYSLKDFKGKWVLIHFWATWCPPCLNEIPDWIALRESLAQDAPLQLVAISLDSQWEDAHRVLPANQKIHGLVSLLDVGNKTPEAYGTFNYPETYLLNPELKIMTKWVGPQSWNSPETIQFFKKLIAQEQPVRSP